MCTASLLSRAIYECQSSQNNCKGRSAWVTSVMLKMDMAGPLVCCCGGFSTGAPLASVTLNGVPRLRIEKTVTKDTRPEAAAAGFVLGEGGASTRTENGSCLGSKSCRTNALNVRFLADHACFTPNGRPWRRVIGTAAPDPLRKSVVSTARL